MKPRMKQTGLATFVSAILATALLLTGSPLGAQSEVPVFINEIHYDNTGGDVDEAIEIAGPAGTDLTGWSIVLYNGSNGIEYDTQVLSGVISDQQNGFGALTFAYPANGIQNGSPDGIALVNPANAVVHFLSYEGSFTAVGGPADGMTSMDIGASELNSTASGQSLQLVGVGIVLSDFAWSGPAASSQGRVNNGQIFTKGNGSNLGGQCGDPATVIHDIQGTDDTFDANFGGLQSIEGVVVGDFSGLSGFYVQEEDSDADDDPATSEGIFVFMGGNYGMPPVTTGTKVRLRGVVDEHVTASGSTFQTQISNPSVLDCGPSSVDIALTEIMLPVGSIDEFERYEGMLVRFPQELAISEYFNYDRFGELVLALPLPPIGEGRPYQGTAVAEPGAESQSIWRTTPRTRSKI